MRLGFFNNNILVASFEMRREEEEVGEGGKGEEEGREEGRVEEGGRGNVQVGER